MTTEETNLNNESEVIEATVIADEQAVDNSATSQDVQVAPTASVAPRRDNGPRGRGQGPRGRGGSRPGGPRRETRSKPEFDQKIIDIRRVTRVASGGRRFSFAVSLVAGDKRGRVGVGTGKGGDTALAVEKAFRNAKKNMITLNLTKSGSIAHDVKAKYSAAVVEMRPAPGKGIAAGSSVRDVIDLAGVKDIIAKLRSGSKNKLNNAQVAVKALSMVKKPRVRKTA